MKTVSIDKINQFSLKIEGLWREDNVFEWTLNPDVNILSGQNGSGKSTVLRILYFALTGNNTQLKWLETHSYKEFRQIRLTLNDKEHKPFGIPYEENTSILISNIDFFASLDQEVVPQEDIQIITNADDRIRSQIDFDIFHYQNQYTKYLLSVSKKAEKAYANGQNIAKKLAEVYAQKNLFFEMIDNLFAETNKKIDRESDDIQFIKGENTPLSVYDLSTGEKQMLLILLKVLFQNQQQSIYILDEPEISMHPDWQEHLIDNIRKLNPNVMVIIATHSPDIIVNGWLDKVVDMRDLLKPLTTEMQHGA